MKHCTNLSCLNSNPQPVANFQKSKDSKDKLTKTCKTCIKATEKNTYGHIIQRCYNKRKPNYKNWGAKGVRIFSDWIGIDGYKKWFDYVSKLPHFGKKGRTLDRFPDPSGDYMIDNLRWATGEEQAHNHRRKL